MRRRKSYEYTCICNAYNFPHRLGGGKCNGIGIVIKYLHSKTCFTCPCYVSKTCEVIEGSESIKQCRALEEFLELNEIKL